MIGLAQKWSISTIQKVGMKAGPSHATSTPANAQQVGRHSIVYLQSQATSPIVDETTVDMARKASTFQAFQQCFPEKKHATFFKACYEVGRRG
jgi:hypothetical protein